MGSKREEEIKGANGVSTHTVYSRARMNGRDIAVSRDSTKSSDFIVARSVASFGSIQTLFDDNGTPSAVISFFRDGSFNDQYYAYQVDVSKPVETGHMALSALRPSHIGSRRVSETSVLLFEIF